MGVKRAVLWALLASSGSFLVSGCGGGGQLAPMNGSPVTSANGGTEALTAIPSHYSVVDLGAGVLPLAINGHNQVVGATDEFSNGQAFLYSNGALRTLGTLLGDVRSVANDINDSGTIIGSSYSASGHSTAALFSPSASPQSLGTGNNVDSLGQAVNKSGQLFGTVLNNEFCYGQVALFDGYGGAQDGSSGDALAVAANAEGVVLYTSLFAEGGCQGFVTSYLYPSNTLVPEPSNSMPGDNTDAGTAINDRGDVVGYYRDSNFNSAGFYDHNGSSIELLPSGYGEVHPQAINNDEWIAGWFQKTDTPDQRAFISSNGQFTDVNSLLPASCAAWTIVEVRALNDAGYMVGQGRSNGQLHGVLLVPQP